MFRRTFWFTAGAAAGVWASHKVNQKLQRLTPESLAAQAADKALDAGHRIKDFALDVRAGMLQREAELDDVLGLNAPPEGPGLPPARRPALEGERHPVAQRARQKYPEKYPKHPNNRNEDH
ncbi:hypothetical protein M3398_04390 [Streptomyces albidoflavus]|uniref:hypothetical protein n=1 Tax=Streptomyces albidoflavus TaxID=1886 RepID=UPI0020BF4D24|nr:hypothetical protein [Streptomyces albidoflavus]MCL6276538.1 hypothetical protein [Streptomyces albidoflavus]MCX4467806.1 hypothetical protein [Streptomyces albidoflavus]WSB13197.1 hypothetical protein OHB37_03000 [Streptomyces albidoflavus]WSI90906.1 hypothetical protein OG695_03125 [Streptomyces albidoflavus]